MLSTRRFLPLFLTQFCGAFNDNLLKNSLIILITYRSVTLFGVPPDQMVALAGGVFILPFFLFSATAGQLADKYDKSRIIFWVKLAELAIMFVATIGFLLSHFELLLSSLFMMGVHSTFFGPVKYSILPQHLSNNELAIGNAWVEAGTFLAILLGTLLGGLLVATSTASVCIALLFIAFLGFVCCRYIPAAPPSTEAIKVKWNPLTTTVSLLKLARGNRSVWTWLLAISWFWYYGATVLSLLPTIGKEILHVSESGITFFLALFSIGIGAGSLLCGKLFNRTSLKPVRWGAAGMTLFTIVISAILVLPSPPHWCLAIALFAVAFSGGFFAVPLYTLMQEQAEAASRSRVIAANNIMNALFMVVAAVALATELKLGIGAAGAFAVLAGFNTVASLIFLRNQGEPKASPL